MLTQHILAVETKRSFVLVVVHLNNKQNVYKELFFCKWLCIILSQRTTATLHDFEIGASSV